MTNFEKICKGTSEGLADLFHDDERLQTLPDYYTSCVADTHRYNTIGNGWTVDVIAHIFENLV